MPTDSTPLKILIASSEVAPLAKTGGLADVTAALAAELNRRKHDVRLVMPLYPRVTEGGRKLRRVRGLQGLKVELGPHRFTFSVLATRLPGSRQDVWCLECPPLYDRQGIYTQDDDEHLRFAFLSRAVLALCQASNWAPDILHCNDWHLGLAPLYLKLLSSWERLFQGTRTVLTIHNIGYQGIFPASEVGHLGLDDAAHLLHQEDLAAGRINFMKTGLLYADVLTTVSRTYAREIQTPEYGMGLDELLRGRADHLVGIVNGVDYDEWSPEKDPRLPVNYSARKPEGKLECKRALLTGLGLPFAEGALTFGIVSRLVGQKGFELLFETLPELLGHHDARLVVLGSGESRFESFFAGLQQAFPRKVCYYNGYNDKLAHLIEAGADAFLMPSRYEPCGLNQMYSLKYGTVPIVRRTGGLADTVQTFDRQTGEGTGIVFEHFDAEAMRRALRYALELWHDPPAWRRMMQNGMAMDFSWRRQAGLYEELYHRLLGRVPGRA